MMAMTSRPSGVCSPSTRCHRPFFGHGVRPVAVQHAGVEAFLGRQMPHTGHERLPERPVIGPSGKDFVHGRVVNSQLALGVVRHGQTLPLHAGVEHLQDEVKDPVISRTCKI